MQSIPFPPGSRLVAYLRDSGGDEQDMSIDQQESHIGEWCREHGYILTRVFKDVAKSGSSSVGREGFQEMIQHFRDPGCQEKGVVLWKYSRFARDIDDAQFYKADLRRSGFIVYSIKDLIPEGLDGRFFESALDWMNARYLEDLKTDIKRGQLYLAEVHKCYPLGRGPAGYLRQPVEIGKRRTGEPHIVSRLVPDPDTAPLIRQAFTMRAQGMSYVEIDKEVHLFSNKPNYSRMFHNKIYVGIFHFQGRDISDFCEPIIDAATWEAVQEINKKWLQRRDAYHPRRSNSRFLLTGKLKCGICGKSAQGRTTKNQINVRYDYYDCRYIDELQKCNARRIPVQDLDTLVMDAIRRYVLLPENLQTLYKEAVRSVDKRTAVVAQQLTRERKRLHDLDGTITRLVNAIKAAGHSAALIEELTTSENERKETQKKLAELELKLQEQRRRLPELDDTQLEQIGRLLLDKLAGDFRTRQLAIRMIVKEIRAYRDNDNFIRGEITFYMPEPLHNADLELTLPL